MTKRRKKIQAYLLLKVIFPAIYKVCSLFPLDAQKVIIVEPRFQELSNSFRLIYETLDAQTHYRTHVHCLARGSIPKIEYLRRCLILIADVATSKYIFLSDAINIFCHISKRRDSVFVQLWHACGAFKKFGLSTAELLFGASLQEQLKYSNYSYLNYFTVSSPEVIWAYQEATGLSRDKIVSTGISRTDIFFDKDYLVGARKRLQDCLPWIENRKIILYAPTFRGSDTDAQPAEALSIPLFYQELADEYVLLIKQHPLVKIRNSIPEQYRSFAADLTDFSNITDLLCAADICITDYSSLIFEYSLLERPLIFFAYDIADYNKWRGFYYDYEALTPGPVFIRNGEMVQYIKEINANFQPQRICEFKKKFMGSCDGQSTKRILDLVFGKEVYL